MTADCFLDTNVLVYAAMSRTSSPAKHARARLLISETNFAISAQVLQEFYVSVTRDNVARKGVRPLSTKTAAAWLDCLTDRPCAAVDSDLVKAGAAIAARYQTSYWDGAIIAAAERLGAPILYTEDLNDGQSYGSVRVANPFRPN